MSESVIRNALYRDCPKCGGAGQWNPPIEERGAASRTYYSPQPCPDCDGVGALASSEGQAILDLINRWRRAGKLR